MYGCGAALRQVVCIGFHRVGHVQAQIEANHSRLAGHPEALGLPSDCSGTALALISWLHPEQPAFRS
jgi:hypothetical protein